MSQLEHIHGQKKMYTNINLMLRIKLIKTRKIDFQVEWKLNSVTNSGMYSFKFEEKKVSEEEKSNLLTKLKLLVGPTSCFFVLFLKEELHTLFVTLGRINSLCMLQLEHIHGQKKCIQKWSYVENQTDQTRKVDLKIHLGTEFEQNFGMYSFKFQEKKFSKEENQILWQG
jgi:hypothetical protein